MSRDFGYASDTGRFVGIAAITIILLALIAVGGFSYDKHADVALQHRLAYDCERKDGIPVIDSGRITCTFYVSPERQVEAQMKLRGQKPIREDAVEDAVRR